MKINISIISSMILLIMRMLQLIAKTKIILKTRIILQYMKGNNRLNNKVILLIKINNQNNKILPV